ncbi:unnamed protein product [Schistosoma rodhaini]|uniref:DNA repair nuclease/redox regulator APEX1 n=1 Tax=Schistosoma rodhaini TaxID=6188 RepID=A0AA85ERW7_9TREM|nr:unnamed protein product [Schistosoma rodhaini]
MTLNLRGILTSVFRMSSKRTSNLSRRKTVEKKPRNQSPEDKGVESPETQNLDWCTRYPGSSPELANPLSSKWNFKIVSWNVNGIRAVIKNNGMEYIKKENADIFCIQETKCPLHKIPSEAKVPSYQSFWSSADKAGYAGTALFSKISPIKVTYGIGKKMHDDEGRVITAEYDKFYLVTAYVPNSGQGLVRLPYREKEWDPDFLEYLSKLDSTKPVIVCGDLNVAHEEIDLARPETNHKTAGFTDQERSGFTKLLSSANLIDTYRHFYPDRRGVYSFWSYRTAARSTNNGWRLDYFLVSERILANISDQEIRCGVTGSDHCPVVLYLQI